MSLRAAPLYILGVALLPIIIIAIIAALVSVAVHKIKQSYHAYR
jgi:hypothetical protein